MFFVPIRTGSPVYNFTIEDVLRAVDVNFIHHQDNVNKKTNPCVLSDAYGSTLLFNTPSYTFNGRRTWVQKVLFQDFVVLAEDKDIPLRDAINYAIDSGDVHFSCDCPAQKWFGYKYIDTQLGLAYGLDKNNHYPTHRNPGLRGVCCKHLNNVLWYIQDNKAYIRRKFGDLYNRPKGSTGMHV